ncbi:zf-HC2 domain-containing protein [Paenibacillus allorhizosphaerae]|uniref:Zf-HC2 domain-containing protein n=1 Tax=Paenibacillus allorhizosphaerae TaxID=2849866 RepID=A0ABN7TU18_9BACL|nr:zf-HC2 domain-containing protein [Paenibacillus allorhizosphaerae]CAG7655683.1 hypothetical protein PAECIP111802_06182 [Paenibacillus allorhizosphaerae]
MNHIPVEQWKKYVEDELEPVERERCEAHLIVCDLCLEQYMQCLEQSEGLPLPDDEAAFAAAAMNRFDELCTSQERNAALTVLPAARRDARLPLLHHPFFHYAVAAVITLILMGSGVFQTITQQIAHIEPDSANAAEPADEPFSKIIMNHTLGMLDSIQPKRERGSTP